jgi:Raf kinase inhibitor-like YbhB/YbcL family protein
VRRASLLLLAALAGCSYDLELASCRITCSPTDQCPGSMSCQDGFCVAPGAGRCGGGASDAEVPDAGAPPRDTATGGTGGAGGAGGVDASVTPPRDSAAPADASFEALPSFTVISNNFSKGATIPPMFGCKNGGPGISPSFTWTPGPTGTRSYAIMLTMAGASRDEWIIWDIPGTTSTLPMNLPSGSPLSDPPNTKQWNWQQQPSYYGPCPPTVGVLVTYYWTMYAVDVSQVPGIPRGTSFSAVIAAVKAHAIGTAGTSGRYGR